jgi:hypothetical protein
VEKQWIEGKIQWIEIGTRWIEIGIQWIELKFVKAEREKEVTKKGRDFVGRFLFKLSKKLNYDDIRKLSDEYEYGVNLE